MSLVPTVESNTNDVANAWAPDFPDPLIQSSSKAVRPDRVIINEGHYERSALIKTLRDAVTQYVASFTRDLDDEYVARQWRDILARAEEIEDYQSDTPSDDGEYRHFADWAVADPSARAVLAEFDQPDIMISEVLARALEDHKHYERAILLHGARCIAAWLATNPADHSSSLAPPPILERSPASPDQWAWGGYLAAVQEEVVGRGQP